MAKQASDLLNDPAKLKTMGLAGLKLINENYSLEKIEKIWEEAIKIVNSQVTNYNTNFNLGSTPKENNFFNNHDKH
jgi:hypothetical protein